MFNSSTKNVQIYNQKCSNLNLKFAYFKVQLLIGARLMLFFNLLFHEENLIHL